MEPVTYERRKVGQVTSGKFRCCRAGSRGYPKVPYTKAIEKLHDLITASHLGVQKLQAKVKNEFYWPALFKDVRRGSPESKDCGSSKMSGPVEHGYYGAVARNSY